MAISDIHLGKWWEGLETPHDTVSQARREASPNRVQSSFWPTPLCGYIDECVTYCISSLVIIIICWTVHQNIGLAVTSCSCTVHNRLPAERGVKQFSHSGSNLIPSPDIKSTGIYWGWTRNPQQYTSLKMASLNSSLEQIILVRSFNSLGSTAFLGHI